MLDRNDWLKILGFFSVPFAVYLFNYVLFFIGTYDVLQWIDIPMHFLGGISMAIAFYLSLSYFQAKGLMNASSPLKVIFIVSFVALVAVLWEFYEFSLEHLTGFNLQGDLTDTMADLFWGTFGGTLAGIYLVFTEKN